MLSSPKDSRAPQIDITVHHTTIISAQSIMQDVQKKDFRHRWFDTGIERGVDDALSLPSSYCIPVTMDRKSKWGQRGIPFQFPQ